MLLLFAWCLEENKCPFLHINKKNMLQNNDFLFTASIFQKTFLDFVLSLSFDMMNGPSVDQNFDHLFSEYFLYEFFK